jgi:hypothetical protein
LVRIGKKKAAWELIKIGRKTNNNTNLPSNQNKAVVIGAKAPGDDLASSSLSDVAVRILGTPAYEPVGRTANSSEILFNPIPPLDLTGLFDGYSFS